MAHGDPLDDYRRAVERLAELDRAVAAQQSQEEVLDSVTRLRLAVVRAYGGRRPRNPRGRGAPTLILEYLQENLGSWVYGDELAAVSGIGEWARRVRELRVERGYRIEEDDGCYRLLALEPDVASRDRWRVVSEVKDLGGTPIDRIRTLLHRLVGDVVTVDELDRVAGSRDGVRMARELRAIEGLPVEFSVDAPDLRSGQFRLASSHSWCRLDENQRHFPEDVREPVFRRDGYRCRVCGLDRGTAVATVDDPFYLVVRHLDAASGSVEPLPVAALVDISRMAAACNRCGSRRC
jgi:hypothetical protein